MIYAPIRPTWTRAMVQHRLVEADRVIARTTDWPMRIRKVASDVPQYIRTEEDRVIVERGRLERLKLAGCYDDAGNVVKPVPFAGGGAPPSTEAITRATAAFWWPADFVADDVHRICLVTFIYFKAQRTHGFPNTVRKKLKAIGVQITQGLAYDNKDKALDAIARALNAACVPILGVDDMPEDRKPLGHPLVYRAA